MVYFPRESISFSLSTVLSSTGFSSLFSHYYSFFCFLVIVVAPISTVLMFLLSSADLVSALLDNEDEALSVRQNGFSAVDRLILHVLEGGSFCRHSASPLPLMLGWRGMHLYG